MDDKEKTQRVRIQFQHCLSLFTIGFLHLHFWQGVLAIVLWPYYLASILRRCTERPCAPGLEFCEALVGKSSESRTFT